MNRLWRKVLPELERFPVADQPRAMRLARENRLDAMELALLAIWLVLVSALMRNLVDDIPLAERQDYRVVTSLFLAVPMLLVVVPIHIRRLRRGLRTAFEQRSTS